MGERENGHFDTGVFVSRVDKGRKSKTPDPSAGFCRSSAFTAPLGASPLPQLCCRVCCQQSSEKRRAGNCRALTSSGNRKAGNFLPTITKACGTQRCCEHPCPGVTRQRPGQQGHQSPSSSQCKVRLGEARSGLKA